MSNQREIETEHPVTKNYLNNLQYLKNELGYGKSFDILHLELEYGGRKMALFVVDGFANGNMLQFLMRNLSKLSADDLKPNPIEKLMKTHLPYIELNTEKDLDKCVWWVLAGPAILVVEGMDEIIVIDERTYPSRQPQEPDIERVVRGPHDGFVETIIFNTALTRRRVRDNTLRMEYLQIGKRSKADICLSYIEDIADPRMVKHLRESLKKINTDDLSMGEKAIDEFLTGRYWNPYLTIRYTERPDVAAANLIEGHIVIFVDGSPSAMITPMTFWGHLQYPEEFRERPVVGGYIRLARYLSVLISIFLLPLWYLLASHPHLAPHAMLFIPPKKVGPVPLVIQVFLIELGVDILRMGTIHTPKGMGSTLGLFAAIVIGQVSTKVGLFTNQVILYLAIAVIATFATPSYELGWANRLTRLSLFIVTAILGVPGFVGGTLCWILILVSMKSFDIPYMWPVLPFAPQSAIDVFIRKAMPLKKFRPVILHPGDPVRRADRKQKENEKPMHFTKKCMVVGFFGGLITSTLGLFAHLLNFTSFGPAIVFSLWKSANGLLWQVLGVLVIALLSIIAALIYKITLAKWQSMWGGIGFGMFIWFLLFFSIHPLVTHFPTATQFNLNTLVTTICLILLYGLFIGYSISFEYSSVFRTEKVK